MAGLLRDPFKRMEAEDSPSTASGTTTSEGGEAVALMVARSACAAAVSVEPAPGHGRAHAQRRTLGLARLPPRSCGVPARPHRCHVRARRRAGARGRLAVGGPHRAQALARSPRRARHVAMPVVIRAAEDGVVHPVPGQDVLCALADAAATARADGLEPERLVLLGHSSGAHLSALAALAPEDFDRRSARTPPSPPTPSWGWPGRTTSGTSRMPPRPCSRTTPDRAQWDAANPLLRAGRAPRGPLPAPPRGRRRGGAPGVQHRVRHRAASRWARHDGRASCRVRTTAASTPRGRRGAGPGLARRPPRAVVASRGSAARGGRQRARTTTSTSPVTSSMSCSAAAIRWSARRRSARATATSSPM